MNRKFENTTSPQNFGFQFFVTLYITQLFFGLFDFLFFGLFVVNNFYKFFESNLVIYG